MYVCICVCDIITMPYVLQECNWSCKMFVFGAYVCDIIPCHMSYRGATEYAECMCLVRMCVWYHNRVMCPAGVQLIATAHGNVLENVIKNPSLADLGECVCMWARVCVCLCESVCVWVFHWLLNQRFHPPAKRRLSNLELIAVNRV